MNKFKNLFIILFVTLLSGCCCRHRKIADTNPGDAQYVYIKVTEGPETYRYFLKNVSECEFEGKTFFCGEYAEDGWLEKRPMYVNPKYITSMAKFNSPEDFKEALKKSDD